MDKNEIASCKVSINGKELPAEFSQVLAIVFASDRPASETVTGVTKGNGLSRLNFAESLVKNDGIKAFFAQLPADYVVRVEVPATYKNPKTDEETTYTKVQSFYVSHFAKLTESIYAGMLAREYMDATIKTEKIGLPDKVVTVSKPKTLDANILLNMFAPATEESPVTE